MSKINDAINKTKEPADMPRIPPQPEGMNKPATHVLISIDLLNEVTRLIGEKLTWTDANPLMSRLQNECHPVAAEPVGGK